MTANRDNSPATSPKASTKPGDKVPVSPRDDDVDSTLNHSSDDCWAGGCFTKRPTATTTAARPIATVTRPEVVQRRMMADEALSRSPGVGLYSEASTAPRVYSESPSVPDGYSEKTGGDPRSFSESPGSNPGRFSETPSSTRSYSETSSTQGRYSETPSVPARYPGTSGIPESYPEKTGSNSSSVTVGYSEAPSVPERHPEKAGIFEGCPEKTGSNPGGGYSETPSAPAGYPDTAGAQPRGYLDLSSSSSQGVYAGTPSISGGYTQPSSVTGVYAQQSSIPEPPGIPGRYPEASTSNPESYPEKNSTPGAAYSETPGIPGRFPGPPGMPVGCPEMHGILGRSSSETPSNPGSYSEKTSNPGSYSETASMSGSYSEPPMNSGRYSETVAVGGDPSNPIFRFGRAYASDGSGIGVGLGHEAPVSLRAGGGWVASLEKVGGTAPFSGNPGTVSDAASLSDGATSPGSSGLGSSFHSVEAGLAGEGGMGDRKGSSASFDASFDTQGIAGSDGEHHHHQQQQQQQPEPIAKRLGRNSSNKLEMKAPLPFPPPSPSAGGLDGGFGGLEYGIPDLGRGKDDLADAFDILLRDVDFEEFGDADGGDLLL